MANLLTENGGFDVKKKKNAVCEIALVNNWIFTV